MVLMEEAVRAGHWADQPKDRRAMAWMWGLGERHKGLRNVLGSKKRLGTTSEFVLSQNRNETLVNLRLLYWTGILPIVFLNSQQKP